MNFKALNNITGWIVFAIATVVYFSTLEPTVSFWDCGEFIASAFKLEIGHPPGAPLFMLIGRIAGVMAPDKETVALYVNGVSGLSSSFTILFLFWSISILARKFLLSDEHSEPSFGDKIAILGASAVGSLAFTFSDSFWFSAVEGEVYAMSSLFTAAVFWLILKWDQVADRPYANRYLILIAYLMGLSIGVHLLNLLAIPAMTFVYYFRKYKVTQKGIAIAAVVGMVILGFVQGLFIPMTVKVASWFELLFVNGMGMPFHSGLFFYLTLVVASLVAAIYYTRVKGKVLLNIAVTCWTVMIIGYSSYAIIIIRSAANPPMDENNPENTFSLLSYLNREQYGDRPLLYGHYYNSPMNTDDINNDGRVDKEDQYAPGNPVWSQDFETGQYYISDDKENASPIYAKEFCTVFPRMYSQEGRHASRFGNWVEIKGKKKRYRANNGEMKTIVKPTFGENLTYFFSYQIGYMYGRYFMWNFAGKQNDNQGFGDAFDGNWITGISFIDEMRLGSQEDMPEHWLSNKGRNRFFMLPFLLGLFGFIYTLKKDPKKFSIIFLLFVFTGLMIIVYLNEPPIEPRERDYTHVGSFYAFAIWIGLGVLGIVDLLRKITGNVGAGIIASLVGLLAAPVLMANDGWDDHNRSDTYTARDFAKNYLNSCDKNAILFTNGDNDTFPLWYVQEVEEYRTDVRVCNLSLMNTDWYIDQMRRKAYDSDAVPFSIPAKNYVQGTRDYIPIVKQSETNIYLDLREGIDFIKEDKNRVSFGNGQLMNYFPTDKFSVKVDSAKVLANGTVSKEYSNQIADKIEWKFNKGIVMKNDMMILDLLATFNWDRPVYFAITTGNDSYIGLENYFQLEGLAYRLIPVKMGKTQGQIGRVNTTIMYDNMMNKFQWGGMDKKEIYLNENNQRMCMNLRNNFARLADALIAEGKIDSAKAVLDRALEVMPEYNVPHNYFSMLLAEGYYKVEEKEKGNALTKRIFDLNDAEMKYFLSLDADRLKQASGQKAQQAMGILYRAKSLLEANITDQAEVKQYTSRFDELQEQLKNIDESGQRFR